MSVLLNAFLNCSVTLNCKEPSNKPQAITASNIWLTEVATSLCSTTPARGCLPETFSKTATSTTEVSNSPGSWSKNKDPGMMCRDSSTHTTRCVPPVPTCLQTGTGLSAAQINQRANWDISKRTGWRSALAKSPAETDSTPLEAKACLCSSSHRNSLGLVSLFWLGGVFVWLLL